jgi:hypothetical protein
VTFAVTLHDDGTVDYVYGPAGNKSLGLGSSTPVVGYSDGGCSSFYLDGYSRSDSLANAPAVRFRPVAVSETGVPTIANPSVPFSPREGQTSAINLVVADPDDDAVTVTVALPRNATFDAGANRIDFTPDSAQDGIVQFLVSAVDSTGKSATRSFSVLVQENFNLPEVDSLVVKGKVTFVGTGFGAGVKLEIDGAQIADAKNNKRSPATKIASKGARAVLTSPGLHTVVVVNPDGTRSGPFYSVR